MSILNRIRYVTQRGKRQKMLNRYGFYVTIETYNDVVIWNSPFGIEIMPDRHQHTTFHIHTMLDCPFLIKPHHKGQTEYSCQLLLNSETYNIELKDLINLLENPFADYQDTPLLPLSCECLEWTGHISSNFLQSGWTDEDDTEVQKLDSTKQIETPMQQIEIWQANPLLQQKIPARQWMQLMTQANAHELNQHVEWVLETELQIQGKPDQMRIAELLWYHEKMPKEMPEDGLALMPNDRREYLMNLIGWIDRNPMIALNDHILHKNNPEQTKTWNKEKIEEILNSNEPGDLIRALKQLIHQMDTVYPFYHPIPDPYY